MLVKSLPQPTVKLGGSHLSLSVKLAPHLARDLRDLRRDAGRAIKGWDGDLASDCFESALELKDAADSALRATRAELELHNAILAALDSGETDSLEPCVLAASQARFLADELERASPGFDTGLADTRREIKATRDALIDAIQTATDRLRKASEVLPRAAKAAVALADRPGDLDPRMYDFLPDDWQRTIGTTRLTRRLASEFDGDLGAVETTRVQHRLRRLLSEEITKQATLRSKATATLERIELLDDLREART